MGRARDERGASAVEFAIVASLLFLVLFGAVQFGIAFNRMQGVHAAAREGARLASLPQTTVDEIVARVRDTVSIIHPDDLSVGCGSSLAVGQGCIDVTPAGANKPCDLRSGEMVSVAVRYRGEITVPFWRNAAVTLTGTGDFRCE